MQDKGITLPSEHISASQINTYLRCPAQYYFRYVRGIKIPPSSALTRGKCVHAGVEHNYRQKIESHVDVPVNDVTEYVASEFETLQQETLFEADEDPGQIKDVTVNLSRTYHLELAPKIQPILVEQEILLPIEPYGILLKGYVDLVDDKLWVRDTKTAMRSPNADEINKSLQLSAYAYSLQKITGEMPKGVALDYVVATKVPKVVVLEGTRTEQQINRFVNTAARVGRAISEGCFYPSEHNFLCSPEKCGYWELCHKEF